MNLRRSSWILVVMLCCAVAKLDARQSSRPDKDAVRLDVVEKSPLQFASNRARSGADWIEHLWSEEFGIGGVGQSGWLDCFDRPEFGRLGDGI